MSQGGEVEHLPEGDSLFEKRFTAVFRGFHLGGSAFMVLMMILTTIHVVGRYILNTPVPGLVELSCFMLVIIIYMTGAYTMSRHIHTDMGVVVEQFSERTQAIIGSVIYSLCFAFTVVAAWQGFVRATFLMQEGQTTLILELPHFPFIYILSFGWLLFSLAILMQIIELVRRAVKR